jgi:hypothetical protein
VRFTFDEGAAILLGLAMEEPTSARTRFKGARRVSATRAERERNALRRYGPELTRLPWPDADGAYRYLGARDSRVAEAVGAIDSAWTSEPMEGVIRALRLASRGTVIVHSGARHRLPAWCFHDYRGSVSTKPSELFGERKIDMGAVRLYALEGHDPYAERPVNLATLARPPANIQPLFEMLDSTGLHQQLRVVVYDQKKLMGYFGLYLPKEEAPFSVEEHARLHALVPALGRWLRTARAIGVEPFDETGLTIALESNERASYLVHDDGRVIFANARARELRCDHATLAGAVRAGSMRSVRLALRGETIHLVVLDPQRPPPRAASKPGVLSALPTSLRGVAEGLVRGLSDKEIALELELPLVTIRTYTSRVFSRLGVSSRREVMLLHTRAEEVRS